MITIDRKLAKYVSYDAVVVSSERLASPINVSSNIEVVTLSDGSREIVLGYPSLPSMSTSNEVYSFFHGGFGDIKGDSYGNTPTGQDFTNYISHTKRSIYSSNIYYIGDVFVSGTSTQYGFDQLAPFWKSEPAQYGLTEAPLAPSTDDTFMVIMSGGAKMYQTSDLTVIENTKMRIAVGTKNSTINSHGTWSDGTFTATTVEEDITTNSGYGAPEADTIHIVNYTDDTQIIMNSGTVKLIAADGTTLTFENGQLTFDGDVLITGKLTTQGGADLA